MSILLILTTEPENFVPKELQKEAEEAGWEVQVVNPDECALNVSGEPKLFHKGEELGKADACIPRMSEEDLDYKSAIMDFLSAQGVRMLNSAESMALASNKLKTQILLNAKEVKTPNSAMVANVDQLESAHKSIGGKYPVVLKTLSGTHGVGVMRCDSAGSLMSVAQTLEKMGAKYMIQEYIEHEASRRILMLNGEVVACVSRSVPKDDFRTNAHQGAELTLVEDPSQLEIDVSKKVCELIGTKLGAVDYLVDGDNIIVFELNGSPGWEAMQEKVPEKNIAKMVVAAYELGAGEDPMANEPEAEETPDEKPTDGESPLDEPKGDVSPLEEPTDAQTDVPDASVSGELVSTDASPLEEPKKEEGAESTAKGDTVDYENPEDEQGGKKPVDLSPTTAVKVEVDGEQQDAVVIGSVQSFTIKRFNEEKPISARVDTGATGSSLAGTDIEITDSNISFTFNGVRYRCHTTRTANIKSANGHSERPVVKFDIDINGVTLNNVDFTITDRKEMKFDALLGRNTLAAAGVLINPALGEVPAAGKKEETGEKQPEKTEESVKESLIDEVAEVVKEVIEKIEQVLEVKEVIDTVTDAATPPAKLEESFDKYGVTAMGAETFNYQPGQQVVWESADGKFEGTVEEVNPKSLVVRINERYQEYVQKTNITKVVY